MAINITAVGASGTHNFVKTTVNADEDFIYFSNRVPQGGTAADAPVIPSEFDNGVGFIYREDAGSIPGLTSEQLYYSSKPDGFSLQFSTTVDGSAVDLDIPTSGGVINFNTPIVYDNILNVDSPWDDVQALRYETDGTPLDNLTSGGVYFARGAQADFAGTSELYTFTNATFSTPLVGRTGPSLSQARSSLTTQAADTANWEDTYLNMDGIAGVQQWTVPATGVYEFDIAGAKGGDGTDGGDTEGKGAKIRARFSLQQGEVLNILVGQQGIATGGGGGGGGTFIWREEATQPLLVAGGGGGSGDQNARFGLNGSTSTSGTASTFGSGAGGTNGSGGQGNGPDGDAGAGAGWFSNGIGGSRFGIRPLEGGFGGNNGNSDGGFGGGGAESNGNSSDSEGGGGGGGYSGGGAWAGDDQGGGGGGSYIAAGATNVATTDGNYDGQSTFAGQSIGNIGSYQNGTGYVDVSLIQQEQRGTKLYPTAADAAADTNAIAIAANGSSYHNLSPIAVALDLDRIYSLTPHGYASGQPLRYSTNGTGLGGLNETSVYYANTIDAYTYTLSLTPANQGFTDVNITSLSAEVDDVLSNVVVDTNLNVLTIPNHGFLINQPIQYLTNGNNPIVPLQNQVTYYVKEVLNANQFKISQNLEGAEINFTDAGTGTNHSFIFVTVNDVEDSLYIPAHNLVSGQAVVYSDGGGNTVQGLIDGQLYYVVRVDPNIIKLSTTPNLTGVADITGPGTGTHSLTITSINTTTDTITIPSHGFSTGELVEYDTQGQTEIGGLTSGLPYYVIVVDGDNIQLASSQNNASNGVQIDLTGLGVGEHIVTSLTRTPDGTYTVSEVPTPTTFKVVAPGIVPQITKLFTPRIAVNLQENAINLPSHGFITGTEVTYSSAGNTPVGGLTDDTHYYIIVINRDWIRLATDEDNASSGIALTINGYGVGADHSFTSVQISGNITGAGTVSTEVDSVLVNGSGTAFSKILKVGDPFRLFPPNDTTAAIFADSDVDTGTDQIDGITHGFSTGDAVQFTANGGVPPAPLVEGYWYFARALSDTSFAVYGTALDAQNDTNRIDFSTTGSGTNLAFTKIVPVTPIIRTITAVGSDTQITVDRAYTTAYTGVSYSYPTFVYVRPQGYSLHRPFDGGVEMSVGSGTSYGSIVRQTRKYFRYQSGKGIQTSAGVNFKPTIDIQSAEKESATTIRVTTRRPHGLKNGLFCRIRDAKDSFGDESTVYNGRFQVTVLDELNFTVIAQNPIIETQAYGFPNLHVEEWENGAIRSGMFDDQNGMFYEFDGQKMYAVRRSSTQQIAGTISALQGSEFIFGEDTKFTAQLNVGEYLVLRGQSYRITSITDDTQLTIRPEYKGRSGTEFEFDPSEVVNVGNDSFDIVGHGYTQNLPIIYNSIDGTPIGGLINGRTYYVNRIDANTFRLKASVDAVIDVNLSSQGAGDLHSFVPAKTGIIGTLTVDTRVPQENWSIDPCDGTGVTGYNLDLSRIQMVYIDYSWYGAGKIRFGFKTTNGQVKYVHEFVHNNLLNESYFRSGNMPARYEIATYENPTYIPFLFHWGTSVMMDGRFDDDNAYKFTASSQTLTIAGTTPKLFGSTQIDVNRDYLSIPSHGFANAEAVQFLGIGSNGQPTNNINNPRTQIIGSNTLPNLTNEQTYYVRFLTADRITLHQAEADALAPTIPISTYSRNSSRRTTINTSGAHGLSSGDSVLIYGINDFQFDGVYTVTVTDSDTFYYDNPERGFDVENNTPGNGAFVVKNALNYLSSGQSQDTFFLYPGGALNNTSGANYQPLLSLRLSPSVSEGLTGQLGDRDVINRMQLRLQEIGIQTDQLVDVKLLINGRLNNLNFRPVDSPSLVQVVEHTANDTISGGIQVYNFNASGQNGVEQSTVQEVGDLFELSNSILGGNSVFPDGPDILTVAVARLTGNETTTSARFTWTEAQA